MEFNLLQLVENIQDRLSLSRSEHPSTFTSRSHCAVLREIRLTPYRLHDRYLKCKSQL